MVAIWTVYNNNDNNNNGIRYCIQADSVVLNRR